MSTTTTERCPDCRGVGNVRNIVKCEACDGTGTFVPRYQKKCPKCEGAGEIVKTKPSGARVVILCPLCDGRKSKTVSGTPRDCLACEGSGKKFKNGPVCARCHGEGRIAVGLNTVEAYWPQASCG